MKLRTISTFTTTIPDDTQWGADDEISVPGGNAIACIVRDYLGTVGVQCSNPKLRDSYGWELLAEADAHRFLIVVQMVDEWVLQCEPLSTTPVEATATMLRSIGKWLYIDKRFNNVRWFQSGDFENGDLSKASDQPC